MFQENDWDVETFLSTTIKQVLSYNPHIVKDPAIACGYLVLLGETRENYTTETLSNHLKGNFCLIFEYVKTICSGR